MSTLWQLAEPSRWAPPVWSQLWQVTVLVILMGLLARVIGDRPRIQRALWLLVLAKCLFPPLWSSPAGVFSWAQTAADPGRAVNAMTDPLGLYAANPAVDRFLPWLAMAWAGGVAVIAVRWLRARRRLRQLVVGSPSSARVQQIADDVGRTLGLRNPVRVAVIEGPLGPAVGGLLRPYVLLPRKVADRVADVDLRILLGHEFLHIRRGDLWLSFVQSLVAAVWWFHPLVRWASRRLDDATERCVDQDVIDRLRVPTRQYVASLLSVLEAQCGLQPAWGLPGVRRAELTRERMRAAIDARPADARRPLAQGAALLLGALVLLPGRVQRAIEPPVPECCRAAGAASTTQPLAESGRETHSPATLMQQ